MIFRIPSHPSLSDQLNKLTEDQHDEKVSSLGDYPHRARRIWESRPEHVGVARYSIFKLLHQEFSGSGLMGLATVMGTGRRIARALPWLRKGRAT